MTTNTAVATAATTPARSLVREYAQRMGVEPEKLLDTLKKTAFKQRDNVEISNEQMMALLVVANKYNLNPFVKEIYAFPDKGGIVPIVGVDGWASMINNHPQLDGIEFVYAEGRAEIDSDHKPCPDWATCKIYRKDRSKPIEVTEFFDEVYRPAFEGRDRNGKAYKVNGPWQTHTKRMLRHKVLIQCARLAFGFTGIYDEDEAVRMVERADVKVEVKSDHEVASGLTAQLTKPAQEPEDGEFTETTGPRPAETESAPETAPEAASEPTAEDFLQKIAAAQTEDDLAVMVDLMNSVKMSDAKRKAVNKAYKARLEELDGSTSEPQS